MNFDDFKEKKKFSRKVIIPSLIENNYLKIAEQLKDCGNYKSMAICEHDYTIHFNGANSCKSRFCPVCQKKRSLLWLSKLYPIFDFLIEKKCYINLITLTIKDTVNLNYGLNTLYDSFRYMQGQDKIMRKQFNDMYVGGIRALEVKRGENSNLWHPHLHMLVVKNKKSSFTDDYSFLSSAWQKSLEIVTGVKNENLGHVNITSIKFDPRFKKQSLIKAISECFKYMTKSSWLPDDTKTLVESLSNIRSINSWGNIRYYLQKQNAESDIDRLMNENYTSVKKQVCATCGHDGFIIFNNCINTGNFKIYDFEDALMSDKDKAVKIEDLERKLVLKHKLSHARIKNMQRTMPKIVDMQKLGFKKFNYYKICESLKGENENE